MRFSEWRSLARSTFQRMPRSRSQFCVNPIAGDVTRPTFLLSIGLAEGTGDAPCRSRSVLNTQFPKAAIDLVRRFVVEASNPCDFCYRSMQEAKLERRQSPPIRTLMNLTDWGIVDRLNWPKPANEAIFL
jgi:hypothetical protein